MMLSLPSTPLGSEKNTEKDNALPRTTTLFPCKSDSIPLYKSTKFMLTVVAGLLLSVFNDINLSLYPSFSAFSRGIIKEHEADTTNSHRGMTLGAMPSRFSQEADMVGSRRRLLETSDSSHEIFRLPEVADMENQKKLLHDTAHSATSPLSPHFKGLRPGPEYRECSATSQIIMEQVKESSFWTLKTYDGQGKPKTIGGDEFYITFTRYQDLNNNSEDPVTHETIHHPTYVAIPTDMGDGTYQLSFFVPPMNDAPSDISPNERGLLSINLSYTCGMGLVTQKSDWKSKGVLHWKHVKHDVPVPPSQLLAKPVLDKKLSQYDYVAAFGDSVMGQFVGQYKGNAKFVKYEHVGGFPSKDQVHYGDNIRRPLTPSYHKKIKDDFLTWHHEKLLDERNNNNTAILIGSGPWDLGMITWKGGDEKFTINPALKGYRSFISWLREEYPSSAILWKSQSAVHPHMVSEDAEPMVEKGTRYVSTARLLELERATRQLMKELNVPVLDIYNATYLSADWLYSGDSGHYRSELNQRMLQWFYLY